jgi:glycine/D-amino acid oxidase-like deaminating enzyme
MFPDQHQQDGPAFVTGSPRNVAVVGAGMVGLATAWFLQEAGVQVTVYERDEIGAGASWGNAGWLTPSLTAPLPEPAVLRYGLRAVLSPRSPVYLPLRADGTLLRFLISFARHSTAGQWRRGMAAYVPLNERALEAFDVLAAGGVTARTHRASSFLACFGRERQAQGLLTELEQIRNAGQDVTFHPITGWRARSL